MARELLDDGWSLVVFPEGARSPDGHQQRFRHGASRLSLEAGVPGRADRDPRRVPGHAEGPELAATRPAAGVDPLRPRRCSRGRARPTRSCRSGCSVRSPQLHDEDANDVVGRAAPAERGETPSISVARPARRGGGGGTGSRPIGRRGPVEPGSER